MFALWWRVCRHLSEHGSNLTPKLVVFATTRFEIIIEQSHRADIVDSPPSGPRGEHMRPADFHLERPRNLADALDCLQSAAGDTCVLAGGQSVLKQLRDRVIAPRRIVDISGLRELDYVKDTDTILELGALTSLAMIASAPLIAARCMALAEAAARVGDVQIRTRATLGGNLRSGWSSDLGVVVAAARAGVELCSRRGGRSIAGDELLAGGPNSCASDELIRAVSFPVCSGSAFEKLARRSADPALASAAAFVWRDVDRVEIGLAVGGVHFHPLRLAAVEAVVAKHGLDASRIDAALAVAASEVVPVDTPHAGAAYRRRVLPVIARRALATALRRAQLGDLS